MKKFLGVLISAILAILGSNVVLAEVVDNGESEAILPEIYIRAVNPGYKIDGINNVGEMIELARRDVDSNEMMSLAGLTVSYTNSSGNKTVLVEFSENSLMAGESIILRLASSPGSELAAINYTKTLAFEGGIEILRQGEVVDNVCWTGKEGCAAKFKSSSPTTLVRDEETGNFEHLVEYEPEYKSGSYVVIGDIDEVNGGYGEINPQCRGLKFAEILSYYAESQDEQFVEFHNAVAEQILLDGCQIRYKNKYYGLTGIVRAEGYVVRWLTDFRITKDPTNSGVLELIDVDGTVVDKLEYPNGQRKGTSYAWIGYDEKGEEIWRTTYAVTPGEPNVYQEFKTCEDGKVINEATGNCVKVTTVTEKVCPEGQYLNLLTGRCRKVETTKATTECKDGYELNPETGRCNKIKENTGADYALQSENYEEGSDFIAIYAIVGVLAVGVLYVIYEFRSEIVRKIRALKRYWRKKG